MMECNNQGSMNLQTTCHYARGSCTSLGLCPWCRRRAAATSSPCWCSEASRSYDELALSLKRSSTASIRQEEGGTWLEARATINVIY
jgi:hypothetical protein